MVAENSESVIPMAKQALRPEGLVMLPTPQVLHSTLDRSVNFIEPIREGFEALEARYVRRQDDYLVAYISCQTACERACRFCHLTSTAQIKGRDATVGEILEQGEKVLSYWASQVEAGRENPARIVHFNFMARGEPLQSQVMRTEGAAVMEGLFNLAKTHRLTPAVKLSTIGADLDLLATFPYEQPDFYYSLYSTDATFRRRWLPKAPAPEVFLERLAAWQEVTRKIPTIHHTLIAGENDSLEEAQAIAALVDSFGLAVNVNFVRYNPPTPKHGVEATDALEEHAAFYRSHWPLARVNIVKKVGFDVAASCGMFVK